MYRKILYFFLLFLIVIPQVFSQELEKLGIVKIENALLVKPDTLEFDVKLYRKSDRWDKWANGTFQLNLVDSVFKVNPGRINIEYLQGTSDLTIAPITGGLPTDNYYITPRVFDGRISITIAGPEKYDNSTFVPKDTCINIGRFQITTNNGETLPTKFEWLSPFYFYQACAYKLQNDSIVPPEIIWFNANDNVEMEDDAGTTTVVYDVGENPKPEMILLYFNAEYEGRFKVGLYWETAKEAYNRGFLVWRGLKPPYADTNNVIFDHLVCRWDGGTPREDSIVGLGTTMHGKKYHFLVDTVQYRGEEYCYLLQYQDFDNNIHNLAKDCEPIPHAVIVYADARPNPFVYSTTVKYKLDDDVILSSTVYDLAGNEVVKLIDNQYVKMGVHEVVFEAPTLRVASNGLYEIIFIAKPLDDPTVEVSRAMVKVQLIR